LRSASSTSTGWRSARCHKRSGGAPPASCHRGREVSGRCYALSYALENPAVGLVTAIGRRYARHLTPQNGSTLGKVQASRSRDRPRTHDQNPRLVTKDRSPSCTSTEAWSQYKCSCASLSPSNCTTTSSAISTHRGDSLMGTVRIEFRAQMLFPKVIYLLLIKPLALVAVIWSLLLDFQILFRSGRSRFGERAIDKK